METVKALKCVKVPCNPPEEVIELLSVFRDMVNYCIHVGLEKNLSSRFKISHEVYHKLAKYGYHSWYVLGAIEVATVILKNYRKAKRRKRGVKRPYARRFIAKLGNQAFKIVGNELVFPLKPRRFVHVPLHKRALEVLEGVKLGSMTITPTAIYISYSKIVEVREPKGWIAVDVNEDNVTAVSSDGEVRRYDLSRLKKAGYGYFWRKRKNQQKYAKDRRILRKSLNRLSRNYRNLVDSELHKVSANIAKWCEGKGYGLIHENLKGIRDSVNKRVKKLNRFNGKIQEVSVKGKKVKRRLNSWWFRKFLHMIGYKCLWFGVKVKPEKAGGTSSTCPRCGSKLKEYPNRQVECLNCGYREDRDITACLNLLKASDVSLRFRLERPSDVAVNPALTSPKAMRKSWVSKRGEGISRRVTRTVSR